MGWGCVGTTAWTYVLYYEAMGRALDRGQIDQWYRVEDTPPCKVAQLGGFLGE